MFKKISLIVVASLVILGVSKLSFAMNCGEHDENLQLAQAHSEHEHGAMEAVNVGNKICPVSGQKVGEVGPSVKVEHNGKIYNLCCPGCVEVFKADPDKYIKIVEGEMGEAKGHKGHHHMMGEVEQQINEETSGENFAQNNESISSDAQVKEFNLEAYQHGYSPERLIIKKGDIVKLYATSRDVPHGVFIREYGINVPVKNGSVEKIEFVADKSGEFDILCSVYCGSGHHNMKAKLIVEE